VPQRLAFIFDVDGVIVDSNPVHVQVWREYLRREGVPVHETLPKLMYGRHNDEIVRELISPLLTPPEVLAHGAAKEALYREVMRPQLSARLVPGVVQFLRSHAAFRAGVASNAEPANVEFVLSESGLRECFSVVVDGHQVERPKPAPDIYVYAAALLERSPRDCIVFEDSDTGLESARSAGARVVALRTTQAEFPRADLVIDNFLSPELESWIGRQSQ
jgi:beta-phosphoglucomutase